MGETKQYLHKRLLTTNVTSLQKMSNNLERNNILWIFNYYIERQTKPNILTHDKHVQELFESFK